MSIVAVGPIARIILLKRSSNKSTSNDTERSPGTKHKNTKTLGFVLLGLLIRERESRVKRHSFQR